MVAEFTAAYEGEHKDERDAAGILHDPHRWFLQLMEAELPKQVVGPTGGKEDKKDKKNAQQQEAEEKPPSLRKFTDELVKTERTDSPMPVVQLSRSVRARSQRRSWLFPPRMLLGSRAKSLLLL